MDAIASWGWLEGHPRYEEAYRCPKTVDLAPSTPRPRNGGATEHAGRLWLSKAVLGSFGLFGLFCTGPKQGAKTSECHNGSGSICYMGNVQISMRHKHAGQMDEYIIRCIREAYEKRTRNVQEAYEKRTRSICFSSLFTRITSRGYW